MTPATVERLRLYIQRGHMEPTGTAYEAWRVTELRSTIAVITDQHQASTPVGKDHPERIFVNSINKY